MNKKGKTKIRAEVIFSEKRGRNSQEITGCLKEGRKGSRLGIVI